MIAPAQVTRATRQSVEDMINTTLPEDVIGSFKVVWLSPSGADQEYIRRAAEHMRNNGRVLFSDEQPQQMEHTIGTHIGPKVERTEDRIGPSYYAEVYSTHQGKQRPIMEFSMPSYQRS